MKIKPAEIRRQDYAQVRLPDAEVIRLTGASRTTVAHWRTCKHPPPAAAVALLTLAYTGDLGAIWPEFDGFRIGRDGRLYMPGIRYGFSAAQMLEWCRRASDQAAIELRLQATETALSNALAKLAISEARRIRENSLQPPLDNTLNECANLRP